ncbi:MAG: hypothetical protein K2H20_02440 [Bacilli bacterium]|nr:hypothetical protein [Bacilli bacterium]
MMNMVHGDKEAEKYFITDIETKEDKLIIKLADGTIEELKFTDHNLGFYRRRMIEQAKTKLPNFADVLSKESFLVYVKRVGAIIAGVLGLFLAYNVDIHIIMKIVLTILITLGELAYYLWNEIVLSVISEDCRETLATEYYLAHLQDFQYYDPDKGVDGYILPPEDISKYRLDDRMLAQMSDTIKDFKNQGFNDDEIYLTYQKRQPKKGTEIK